MLQIQFRACAEKQFGKLPHDLQERIYDGLRKLSELGLAHSGVSRIEGTKLGYRLRVGRWRVFFASRQERDGAKWVEIVDIFLKKGREDYQKRMKLLK